MALRDGLFREKALVIGAFTTMIIEMNPSIRG
jgi:hypothetical protein